MLPTPIMTLSIATVVAGLALGTPGSALAQNANASPVAKEKANENAEGAGAQAAGAGSQAAGESSETAMQGEPDRGGPDGHECGGAGHVISQGKGHEDDECGELGIDATATGSIGRAGGSIVGGGGPAVGAPDTCSTEGLRPLVEFFMDEHAAAIREADKAAVAELDGCIDIAGDPQVQSAVQDNPALISALEARGYGVQQVVAADARGDIPTLYVAVPTGD